MFPGFVGSGQPEISNTGRSGALNSCRPATIALLDSYPGRRLVAISSGSATEWLPTLGESWQVVQVPAIDAGLPSAGLSLSPRTPVITAVRVLKSTSPAAISSRAAFLAASFQPSRPS